MFALKIVSAVLGLDIAKCFGVEKVCNSYGQLYLHQGHRPLTYTIQVSPQDILAISSPDCTKTRLISESNVLLPSQTIALIPTKITFQDKTYQEKLQM